MKCMQKQYSDYHFRNECKAIRTGVTSSVHSYIDYADINNSDCDGNFDNTKDKDKDDLNKLLNELKNSFIDNIKDYIKNELKTEIINEMKTKSNIKKKIDENNNKTTRSCCLCKNEKNRDCFYKTGGFCKDCCSEKVSCSICNNVMNRSSLSKYRKDA